MNPPVVLTIAGTDSGGAAGIAADLTTFAALGVHGACVVAAVTAQDTTGVRAIHAVPYGIVEAQLDAVLEDLDPVAVKTGMLGTPDVVRLVADRCADRLLVVDPVLVATSGAVLAPAAVVDAYRTHLLPVATVATPNEEEFVALGRPDRPGVIVTRGGDIATTNDHGTGCTHSSALAAYLAHGADIPTAADRAAAYVARQLCLGRDWTLGRGRGPVAHIHHSAPTQGEIA
ncbi:bifunctional hydroxymethylpyrimidine kinase/phosphomethylpyrimidine kinase [Nocardioides carbamazepini]|uniref:bifunctional hydroxymethylpyrimidine kinase/phosphomethylpyrimidine kinase n=1 Tax=Nocardioides carbamazepini TaxID=2854259 RepID=UPI00214A572F|nr:bifunctional hydroxymethylpyrimidine kinase/phosphomethylpyrimidine kinase [Nocardioides carbamazepini]MCR1784207.1 bifunctional hydroxymethylpyrimidine kinase/phosphomethylpyrimidine kinase [Nocardioides carbamazepini]